ncbi:hypothetical protein KW785_03210 [Candidatus Parcubacteria bacterium]|nr:hypothetical protein [Candidatus Parcubacteria bacterium]
MNSEKGFIIPALAILGVAILGSVVYYYSKNNSDLASSTPAAVVESVDTDSETPVVTGDKSTTTTSDVTLSVSSSPSKSKSEESLVQVTAAGTLAQRLGLTTLTNLDYSYAISYPKGWTSSGASSLVTVTNGRSSIVISSTNISSGTTAQSLAAQNGDTNGFITTRINAYSAFETSAGNQNVYYIVNGSVGYRLAVTDLGDSGVLETELLTFTVTKQR